MQITISILFLAKAILFGSYILDISKVYIAFAMHAFTMSPWKSLLQLPNWKCLLQLLQLHPYPWKGYQLVQQHLKFNFLNPYIFPLQKNSWSSLAFRKFSKTTLELFKSQQKELSHLNLGDEPYTQKMTTKDLFSFCKYPNSNSTLIIFKIIHNFLQFFK